MYMYMYVCRYCMHIGIAFARFGGVGYGVAWARCSGACVYAGCGQICVRAFKAERECVWDFHPTQEVVSLGRLLVTLRHASCVR